MYPSLGSYIRNIGQTGYDKGYAITPYGRKRFFTYPKKKSRNDIYIEVEKELKKNKVNLDSLPEQEFIEILNEANKQAYREYNSQTNAIKREAGNMPTQGTSADITKLAMVLFTHRIEDDDRFDVYDEGLILTVHDELVAEVKDENAEICRQYLKESMEEAATMVIGDTVKVETNPYIETFWKK